MNILGYRSDALHELASGRAQAIEELDFITGEFSLVYGNDHAKKMASTVVPIKLTDNMTVAKAHVIPGSGNDDEIFAQSLSLLFQRNWTSLLLDSTLRPLSFETASDEYYSEIAQRALIAMQGRYVIVRVFEETDTNWALKCVAVEDQLGQLPHSLELFDIEGDSPHRQLYETAKRQFESSEKYITILPKSEYPDVFNRMMQDGTDKIETIIICPLTVGNLVRGFINVGYNIPIDLNEYVRLAFATIINNICIAMENFHKLHELTNLRNIKTRDFIEHMHIDLMQGFRHSAYNSLLAADIARRRMLIYYNYKGDPKDNPADKLETNIQLAEVALDSMASLRAYSEGKEVVSVKAAFEGAVELLDQQLREAQITITPIVSAKTDLDALINFEAVRSAFANLILNSIQAMIAAKTRQHDRRINVTFKRDGGTILIDYVDSGPGVRIPFGDIHSYEDIWVPGKTSKTTGTGYGLPMVREVFQGLHTGSIDLWKSTRGAHFKIMLRDGLS